MTENNDSDESPSVDDLIRVLIGALRARLDEAEGEVIYEADLPDDWEGIWIGELADA